MDNRHPHIDRIEPSDYDPTARLLHAFFREKKGFVEVPVQHRLSILAACEDPQTIGIFSYAGAAWPLPQTGQMHLEYELLTHADAPGYYCFSTSYRNEPHPIAGRHNLIFPMCEFEMPGTIGELEQVERQLLEFLGFGEANSFPTGEYRDVARRYQASELTAEHEQKIAEDYGPIFFLKNFPDYTSPFWNMRRRTYGVASKIDVIVHGIETIGSAERSVDPEEMRTLFNTISNGMYADILYAQFGEERVRRELDEFLSLNFFERCGGGIGMTRLIRALKLAGVLTS